MTTYVLGAGASHHAGYPLCSELWPHMTDWLSKTPSRNPRFQEAIDTVVRLNGPVRSEEHTSELQSLRHLVCRLLLAKQKGMRAVVILIAPEKSRLVAYFVLIDL